MQQWVDAYLKIPWSQVYRITTSKNEVMYLKHMSSPFVIEAKLLQYWTNQQNHQVPQILAVNSDLNCFLMQESGQCLRLFLQENYRMDWACWALQSYARSVSRHDRKGLAFVERVSLSQNIITQHKILTVFAGLVSHLRNVIVSNLFRCSQALHFRMKLLLTFAI